MLGESVFGSLGRDILWSVNLLRDGPTGIEFGSVKTSVMTANTAIVPRRTAIRRGGIGGSGLPSRLRWTGILEIFVIACGRRILS